MYWFYVVGCGRALPLGVSAVKGRTMRIGTLIALAVAILAAAAFVPSAVLAQGARCARRRSTARSIRSPKRST